MKGCNCQEQRSYQSVYYMLNLNETASEAEITHAFEEEMAALEMMKPATPAEEKLLAAKKQELIRAVEQAKSEPLSQRVQAQYQKRKANAVRLNSFFPVGLLGLLLRFCNVTVGSNGCCDKMLSGFFGWLDEGCCSCSCCPDGTCCLQGLYESFFSNCFCECPTGLVDWYNNTMVVRIIDMGVVIAAVVGAILCNIKLAIDDKNYARQRAKRKAMASDDLDAMVALLQQRTEQVNRFIGMYDRLKAFSLDIRPFMQFVSKLPGATQDFIEMSGRIAEPGSFYDQARSEFEGMKQLQKEIEITNSKVIELANRIQANEEHQNLDSRRNCSSHLTSALHGLGSNHRYQDAVSFMRYGL